MPIVRPSPETVAARKREIARRYARKHRNAWPVTFAAVRLSELNRLFVHRYGSSLPDDDEGEAMARVAVHHIGRLRDASRRIGDWLTYWAPWLGLASRERLIRDALECPLRYRADKLGWKLRLTALERRELKIRTIGAMDQTKAERRAQARASKRQRDHARRRAQGAKPRAEYEAQSLEQSQPWKAEGISRRTWYRRMAQVRAPHISIL